MAWKDSVQDTEDLSNPVPTQSNDDSEWRTIIKLDLHVGEMHLTDQFEWPLTPQHVGETEIPVPTPEHFAKQLCTDLGIGGEFVSIISHSIREQLYYARLNFDEAPKTSQMANPPLRPQDEDLESWEPKMEELDAEELERRLREQERASRYAMPFNYVLILFVGVCGVRKELELPTLLLLSVASWKRKMKVVRRALRGESVAATLLCLKIDICLTRRFPPSPLSIPASMIR